MNNITLTKDQIQHFKSSDSPPSTNGKNYIQLLKDICDFAKDFKFNNFNENDLIKKYNNLYAENFSIVKLLTSDPPNFSSNFNIITSLIQKLIQVQHGSTNLDNVINDFQSFINSKFPHLSNS